jgi:hypothetical protein
MALGKALREGGNNLQENLRDYEIPQIAMGLRLRNYGMSAGDLSQFPNGRFTIKTDTRLKGPIH